MKFNAPGLLLLAGCGVNGVSVPRDAGFPAGQPIDANGKGGPILGGTNHALDVQNPDNLGQQSTDNGVVPNLKWSFSDSKTRIFNGGWVREQVITDLPVSVDIAAAQQHLKKGAIRELHWHRVAEWGYVYAGSVLLSAVDENGKYTVSKLKPGDIWYFPKGEAHVIQGLEDENEYLLVFDDGNFDAVGTTFNIDDWLSHTPPAIVAKSLGIPQSLLNIPSPDPYIANYTINTQNVTGPNGQLTGNNSYVYFADQHNVTVAPGGGGTIRIVDSTTFPISTTIAAAVGVLKPGALRELHWHPNAAEWIYFHKGNARVSVFIGNSNSRTFDFTAGDTATFPDNSGHYIENLSKTDELVYIEIYKSDRVKDISLTQWLALTPADIVANVLHIPLDTAKSLKKEKQLIIA